MTLLFSIEGFGARIGWATVVREQTYSGSSFAHEPVWSKTTRSAREVQTLLNMLPGPSPASVLEIVVFGAESAASITPITIFRF